MSMLDVAVHAALEAGRVLVASYRRPQKVVVKGLRDYVTEADLAAEEATVRVIREGCPGAVLVTEESHATYQESAEHPTWYVDPLDGTTNFARGMPMFSVSVGMARHGLLQCGAVYDPLLDQLFYAERGSGAFLNGERLRVSTVNKLSDAMVLLDWPRDQEIRKQSAEYLKRLAPMVDSVRSRGSAALAFCGVAAGWAEGYFQFTLKPWDVAAGALIVEEAGGRVTDLNGGTMVLDKPDWLVTNGLLHEEILEENPLR